MQKNIKLAKTLHHVNSFDQSGMLNFNRKKELLKNKLFHPQERILNRPILPWVRELRMSIQDLFTQSKKSMRAECVAEIYNHAALIFHSLGNSKYARDACYSQIQLFIHWSKQKHDAHYLQPVFETWINLSRIDRLEGNVNDALNKLDVIDFTPSKTASAGDKLFSQFVHKAMDNVDIRRRVMRYSLLERIKACLHAKRYDELIKFIEHKQDSDLYLPQTMVQEALIIALANTGKINQALDLLKQAKLYADCQLKPIFDLREYEIRAVLTHEFVGSHGLGFLHRLSLDLLKAKTMSGHDILFSLHTAYVMKITGLLEEAIKLIYFCLEASESVEDDLLKAQSLVMLYDFISDPEGKNIIENLMIEHYFETQYVLARKKMLASFYDLKYVEHKVNMDEVTALYEDLLAFSSRVIS